MLRIIERHPFASAGQPIAFHRLAKGLRKSQTGMRTPGRSPKYEGVSDEFTRMTAHKALREWA
jgi:hypothetical protein